MVIDDDHIHAGLGQQLGTLFGAGTDTDGRADTQATQGVLGGERMLGGLHHVLDGDEAGQTALVVEHKHALQAVLVHQCAGIIQAAPFLDRDQAGLGGHDGGNGLVEIGLEAGVPVGDDAYDLAVVYNRQARKLVGAGEGQIEGV